MKKTLMSVGLTAVMSISAVFAYDRVKNRIPASNELTNGRPAIENIQLASNDVRGSALFVPVGASPEILLDDLPLAPIQLQPDSLLFMEDMVMEDLALDEMILLPESSASLAKIESQPGQGVDRGIARSDLPPLTGSKAMVTSDQSKSLADSLSDMQDALARLELEAELTHASVARLASRSRL